MNQFDMFRALGVRATQVSDNWFSDPIRVGTGFASGMFEMVTGVPYKSAPQELIQSLFVNALLTGRWAASGYPTISLGHRAAAFFATTALEANSLGIVPMSFTPPFPAFAIRFPPGLLVVDDDGELIDSTIAFATAVKSQLIPREPVVGEDRWWFKLTVPVDIRRHYYIRYKNLEPALQAFMDGISLWGFNQPTWALAAPDGGSKDPQYVQWDDKIHPTRDVDRRSERVLRSIILGCCKYLSSDAEQQAKLCEKHGLEVTTRASKKHPDGLPPFLDTDVRLTSDINQFLELRYFVRSGGAYPQARGVKLPQE